MKITSRPISKKNSKQIFTNKRTGKSFISSSSSYKQFEKDALWELKSYKQKHTGPVHAEYTFKMKGKLTLDLDNAIASINDVLQKAGIIDDDKNIVSLSAVKHQGFKDWETIIEIEEVK